jgi:hypothetical protein
MPVRKTVRQVAAYYRKSARFAVFIILLASFAIPSVLASGPGSLNLSPNMNLNAVTPFGCGNPFFPSNGYYQASGGVSAFGDLLRQRLPHRLDHDLRPRQGDGQARDRDLALNAG